MPIAVGIFLFLLSNPTAIAADRLQEGCALLATFVGKQENMGAWSKQLHALMKRPLPPSISSSIQFGNKESANEKAASLLQGKPVAEVFIVTHQQTGRQIETASLLQEDRFKAVPSIVLSSERYPIKDKALAEVATLHEHSNLGEFQPKFDATTVHLAGGTCGICLSNTASLVMNHLWYTKKHSTITIRLHVDEVYGYSALAQFRNSQGEKKLRAAEAVAADLLSGGVNDTLMDTSSDAVTIKILDKTSEQEGVGGRRTVTVVAIRPDGKEVRLILE